MPNERRLQLQGHAAKNTLIHWTTTPGYFYFLGDFLAELQRLFPFFFMFLEETLSGLTDSRFCDLYNKAVPLSFEVHPYPPQPPASKAEPHRIFVTLCALNSCSTARTETGAATEKLDVVKQLF